MIVVMKKGAREEDLQVVITHLEHLGFHSHVIRGTEKNVVGAVGDKSRLQDSPLEILPGVEKVVAVLAPYKLASREFKPTDTQIRIGDTVIGGNEIQVMAGPCSVESREQLLETARLVKQSGAKFLRGGAFKPRTSPYSFQGLEEEGLKYLAEARDDTGLYIVTEVMDSSHVDLVAHYTDIIQIGARNMQNFALLKEVARTGKPILLKRGLAASIEEWILAAEYIMTAGNLQVILCERGIRTFETTTRNTLDLSAVPVLKSLTHLPVMVDPSHGTGKWKLVPAMSQAAVAAGADALIIEVHRRPSEALTDGPQSLTPENFDHLMKNLTRVAQAVGRKIVLPGNEA